MNYEEKIKSFCVIVPGDSQLGSIDHHAVQPECRHSVRVQASRFLCAQVGRYKCKLDRLKSKI